MARPRYDAVLFDLLTALLDCWTLWNTVAGSAEAGARRRRAYLTRTYGTGASCRSCWTENEQRLQSKEFRPRAR